MQTEEKTLLSQRLAANAQTFKNVENVVLYGGLIAIFLILLTGGIVTYTTLTSIRELVRGTQYLASGNLAHRVNVRTHDEVRDLANAFNTMAEKLEESKRELIRQGELLEEETAQVEMANLELNAKNVQFRALDEEKNEFLGIAAHDLKKPAFRH